MSASQRTAEPRVEQVEFTGLDHDGKQVFLGLMLGMLVASLSQTIVGPGMPRIVADLGGLEHYSWIATAAMLTSAVAVPIVGKLSDLFGRRSFYIGGLAVFMLGTLIAGLTQSFWMLVAARAVQGLGMGTLLPLSQTIIGDIIPPRQRGKYQGIMGAVFGVSSIIGPLIGGAVTDTLGWRWLFFVSLPVGVVALVIIIRSFHLPHKPQRARIDVPGILTLTPGMVLGLLALSWGGSTYPWASPTIIGMLAVSVVLLIAFTLIEVRAEEPLVPLDMLEDRNVAVSVAASFFVAVAMFGAIIYIPVYAQSVLGVSATQSGLILIPQSFAMIATSILIGLVISRTGRYKGVLVLGGVALASGFATLATVGYGTHWFHLTAAMIVIGIGLGLVMQTYTLVVQNEVPMHRLGVGTASVQFFRNIGSTLGIALLGTVMSSRMGEDIAAQLPSGAAQSMPQSAGAEAGVALDPAATEGIPPQVLEAVRMGLGETMHAVFLTALPFAIVAALLALLIVPTPLRDTLQRAASTTTGSLTALPADESVLEGSSPEADGEPERAGALEGSVSPAAPGAPPSAAGSAPSAAGSGARGTARGAAVER